jgi:hypothetical protein
LNNHETPPPVSIPTIADIISSQFITTNLNS